MTEQEEQLISGLAERIKNAPAPQIDRDAYDLILHTIGSRPDALYVLTQTVLMQEIALNHASEQMEELKRQAGISQHQGFLPGSQAGGWGVSATAAVSGAPRRIRAPGMRAPIPPPSLSVPLFQFPAQCRDHGSGCDCRRDRVRQHFLTIRKPGRVFRRRRWRILRRGQRNFAGIRHPQQFRRRRFPLCRSRRAGPEHQSGHRRRKRQFRR